MKKINGVAITGFALLGVLGVLSACGGGGGGGAPATGATYTLYFSQDSNGNGLYTIDTATGVATIVGAGITGVTSQTVGLAYRASTNTLLGSKWATLLEISRDGSGSVDLGGIGNEALAYDDAAGILYGSLSFTFRTIDPATGLALTTLASPGGDVEGLAVETATGNVYGVISANPAQVLLYDKAGNSWSTVGSTGVSMNNTGLAYHPVTKVLYAINGTDGNVYTLDTTTGAATLVGATGLGNIGGGLAFAKS